MNTHALLEITAGGESSVYATPQNDEWEFAYSEFADAHDGLYFGAINVRFHHNLVENFQDDGLYLSPMYYRYRLLPNDPRIQIYENVFRGVLTALAFGGPVPATTDQVFLYRNVFDLRQPINTGRPSSRSPEARRSTGKLIGDHGSPPWPAITAYHNTIVTLESARHADMELLGHAAVERPRRVFNNIFMHLTRLPGITSPDASRGVQADGNLYWSPAASDQQAAALFKRYRGSELFAASKQVYAPGSTSHSLCAAPKFQKAPAGEAAADYSLLPDSPAVNAGVALPKDWPDSLRSADEAQPDIGALPVGAKMFSYGRAANDGSAQAPQKGSRRQERSSRRESCTSGQRGERRSLLCPPQHAVFIDIVAGSARMGCGAVQSFRTFLAWRIATDCGLRSGTSEANRRVEGSTESAARRWAPIRSSMFRPWQSRGKSNMSQRCQRTNRMNSKLKSERLPRAETLPRTETRPRSLAGAGMWLGLAAAIVLGLAPALALAAKVVMRDGRSLEGKIAPLKSMSADPAAVGDGIRPIVLIDDDLRRYFVPKRRVEEVHEGAGEPLERFNIWQRSQFAGATVASVGPLINIEKFDKFGRRTVRMNTNEGAKDIIQGIRLLTPRYAQVSSLNRFKWDMRIATSSIPRETLSAIIHTSLSNYKQKDQIDQRLRLVRFYLQSERFEDARAELNELVKDYPERKDDYERALRDITQLSARRILQELRVRKQAGQHRLVYAMLSNFPAAGVAGETLQEVQETLDNYDSLRAQGASVLKHFDAHLAALDDSALRERIRPIREELVAELNVNTLERMAPYQQFADAKDITVSQKLSHAISGWLLGGQAANDNLAVSLSLFRVRDLLHQYFAATALGRQDILKQIASEEGGTIDQVALLLANMKPLLRRAAPTSQRLF